jgi:hypothetical protein
LLAAPLTSVKKTKKTVPQPKKTSLGFVFLRIKKLQNKIDKLSF